MALVLFQSPHCTLIFFLQKQKFIGVDMFEAQSIFPNCKMVKKSSIPSPEKILFKIKTSHTVSVLIEDRGKALRKRLSKSNSLDYVGSLIETKKNQSKIDRFLLSFTQTIDLEQVAGSMCMEYPTKNFKSFYDCDEDFVYQEMKQKHNLMPFWAAKTFDEVTKLDYYNTTNLPRNLPWRYLLEGAEESNCLRPCKSTKVEKKVVVCSFNLFTDNFLIRFLVPFGRVSRNPQILAL